MNKSVSWKSVAPLVGEVAWDSGVLSVKDLAWQAIAELADISVRQSVMESIRYATEESVEWAVRGSVWEEVWDSTHE